MKAINEQTSESTLVRHGGTDVMEFDVFAKGIALAIAILTLGGLITKIISWFKRRKQMKRDKEAEILNKLKDLCSGQIQLERQMQKMDQERGEARKQSELDRANDAYIRSRQYIGTVAILDSIMKLAEHQGLTINGSVAKYREENIECLKNGTGIYHYDKYEGR